MYSFYIVLVQNYCFRFTSHFVVAPLNKPIYSSKFSASIYVFCPAAHVAYLPCQRSESCLLLFTRYLGITPSEQSDRRTIIEIQFKM